MYLIIISFCIFIFLRYLKAKTGFINFIFIFTVLFLVASIIVFPKNSVESALEAVNIWLFVVTPSLFPFFIGAELLIHSGLIDFIGIVLEPIMYPLFRIPGKGSFVFAMSVTSGYPVGASLVSELRSSNSISKDEAQRLIALSSTSGPLFMIGAVAIGMLNSPIAGTLLCLAHYLSAITIGLIFRYYGKHSRVKQVHRRDSYVRRSLSAFINLKNKKLTSISLLMSKSIQSAFNSLFMIGGFIIIYSVVIEILNVTSIIPQMSHMINTIVPLRLDDNLTNSVISGLLELTNGCKEIASLNIDLITKLCIISFLIGWGGFSVHSQAMSFMEKTDINRKLYLFSKVLHGTIASTYTYLLYVYVFKDKLDTVDVFNSPHVASLSSALYILKNSAKLGLVTVFIMLVFCTVMNIFLSIRDSLK